MPLRKWYTASYPPHRMRSSRRQPVVVELVGRRRRGPAGCAQPTLGPLGGVERLGHQHVVVDRHDVAADGAHQRREGAGGQDRAARPHAAVRRRGHDAGARRVAAPSTGVRSCSTTPSAVAASARPRGTARRGRRARCRPAPRGRRGTSASRPPPASRRGRAASPRGRSARRSRPPRPATPPGAARWRRRRRRSPRSRSRCRGAAASPGCRRSSPAQPLDGLHLLGPARQAVVQPVRQRRLQEAAVAARGAEGDRLGLQQHHAARRVLLDGLQRRPEPGQAGADHEQVGLLVADQQRAGARRVAARPEGLRLRLGQRAQVPVAAHDGSVIT